MNFLAIALVTVTVSSLALVVLLHLGERRWLQDYPSHRSLHSRPIPRFGGIAIVLGLGSGVALLWYWFPTPHWMPWLCSATAVIVIVSIVDDVLSLPVWVRLLAHASAAGGVVSLNLAVTQLLLPGGALPLGAIGGSVSSLLFVVWMTNLYNFMDGLDGLAVGMTVFGFGGLGFLCWLSGEHAYTLVLLCAIVVASVLYFWKYNLPPARVFMGDTGSTVLGFLAAVFCLWADRIEAIPLWISLILFSPFIVDATVTLALRVWWRKAFLRSHRSHYYQRLVSSGFSHYQVVIGEYVLMAGCVLLAVMGYMSQEWLLQWGVLGALAVIYVLLLRFCGRISRFQ